MNIKWFFDLISLPFLVIPAGIIFIDLTIKIIRSILEKKRLIRNNLSLFQEVLEYDIGCPSEEEIQKLNAELRQKSKLLKQQKYEQIELGHKKVQGLCQLLRRQKDNRDNDAILKLKIELKDVIKTVKKS